MKQWLVTVERGPGSFVWLEVLTTAKTAEDAKRQVAGRMREPWVATEARRVRVVRHLGPA